jgi:hypothetical protein
MLLELTTPLEESFGWGRMRSSGRRTLWKELAVEEAVEERNNELASGTGGSPIHLPCNAEKGRTAGKACSRKL